MKRISLFTALCGCALTSGEVDPYMVVEPTVKYDRGEWGRWRDDDKDCQDARQEVLIAESLVPVTFKDGKTCKVETGKWLDPYTDKTFTNPSDLDVDHMVALRDAHDSGGSAWDRDKKRAFSNDLDDPQHLIAVSAWANRSKGARGPDEWLPPNVAFRCQYIKDWSSVKSKWELTMTDTESALVEYMLRQCDSGCVPALPQ